MPNTVTDEQIKALQNEARAAGDYAQVFICAIALHPDGFYFVETDETRRIMATFSTPAKARKECARVIREAQAQQ